MIIRGGENVRLPTPPTSANQQIASAEVENAVTQDSRIAEAAAVAVPDPILGERVGLGVSLAPGATATSEDIIAEADKRLRYPARPVICVIFPDGLREYFLSVPAKDRVGCMANAADKTATNANGKVLKNEVKDVVGEQWKKQGGKPAGAPKARL
jgi:acyl-CoA synthetase (AMP-forming)/AMP-acid ligase II